MKFIQFLILFSLCKSEETSTSTINLIEDYLRSPTIDNKILQQILESGSIDGKFSSDEIEDIFKHLTEKHPQNIRAEKIGKTYLEQDILAYFLEKDNSEGSEKSLILFTGVHHARELITPTMIVRVFLESLHDLIHQSLNASYLKFNDLVTIPIVNLDSYSLITKSYGTPKWDLLKEKRKNMNKKYCGKSLIDSGVDLNRNYGFHYAEDREDLDQCSETFRGEIAFSEPEVQAVKNLCDSHPNIVAAMNFHSYGNMWIHPFNFMKKAKIYPDFLEQKYSDFYQEFGKEVKKITKSKYGNAIEMVSYSTDGEASDWMLGEKGIVSFSPELGSFNPDAQTFFLKKSLIFSVIQENYKVVNKFLQRGTFEIKGLNYGINNQNTFFVSFQNDSFTKLKKATFKIFSSNIEFLSQIQEVKYENQYSDSMKIDEFQLDPILGQLTFQVECIEQLERFSLYLTFDKQGYLFLSKGINFDLQIILSDQELGAYLHIDYQQSMMKISEKNRYYILSIFIAGIACTTLLFAFIRLTHTFWKRFYGNRRRAKGDVSVKTERQLSEPSFEHDSNHSQHDEQADSETNSKKASKKIKLNMPMIEEENTQDEKN